MGYVPPGSSSGGFFAGFMLGIPVGVLLTLLAAALWFVWGVATNINN
jgi:hypothetical protein